MNFCDKCGSKLLDSVCENCTSSVMEPTGGRKSKPRIKLVFVVVMVAVTLVGVIGIASNTSFGGKLFDSATNAFDNCKGNEGCVVAKEALKAGAIIVSESDIYGDLVDSCEGIAPEGLVNNEKGTEDEIYARTNWLVPCINYLYAEYSSRYGKTIEFE